MKKEYTVLLAIGVILLFIGAHYLTSAYYFMNQLTGVWIFLKGEFNLNNPITFISVDTMIAIGCILQFIIIITIIKGDKENGVSKD